MTEASFAAAFFFPSSVAAETVPLTPANNTSTTNAAGIRSRQRNQSFMTSSE